MLGELCLVRLQLIPLLLVKRIPFQCSLLRHASRAAYYCATFYAAALLRAIAQCNGPVQWSSTTAQCNSQLQRPSASCTKVGEDFWKSGLFLIEFICGPWFLAKFASNELVQAQLSEVAQFPNR
jgi:hypothetical protein